MKIVVQKFGGTSVSSPEVRIAACEHVEDALSQDSRVVVVVSAMGRRGDPYATDTLLGLVEGVDNLSPRDLDILMACGESISAVVFASELRRRGHEVSVLNGAQAGIITTDQHGNARILDVHPKRIMDDLEAGRVVVVTGFQGATESGDITTLGRGGSDTSATALGVALLAEVVDIFTDVEGIMTADPRIVSDAKRLDWASYTEICNLAYQGAKVIHPRAVELAMQKNIPIRVRSTRSKDPGTLVTAQFVGLEHNRFGERTVTGVTQTPNITQVQIEGNSVRPENVFAAMASGGISVDFISVSPGRIAFTVADEDAQSTVSVLKRIGIEPHLLHGCAKVAAVGAGIAGVPGIMAKIVGALGAEGIDILQSADSHTTIWCLVRREHMEQAVRALHRSFLLGD